MNFGQALLWQQTVRPVPVNPLARQKEPWMLERRNKQAVEAVDPTPVREPSHEEDARPVHTTRRQLFDSLHAGVLLGDRDARETTAGVLLTVVTQTVSVQWRRVDQAILHDAVVDAILKYLAAPDRYVPARARLDTFVTALARHRLMTLMRSERRRFMPALDAVSPTIDPQIAIVTDGTRRLLLRTLSEMERTFLKARMTGENRASELAQLVGASALSPAQQRVVVNRVTERIRIRLRRLGAKLMVSEGRSAPRSTDSAGHAPRRR